jgi:hypothetical protein
MSSPTIIRYAEAPDSIITVTTTFSQHRWDFLAYVQVYSVYKSGRTTLEMTQVFEGETGAIELFEELVAGIPD